MTEQSRDEELRRLATVVRDSNDAIMLVDFKGGIHAWNRGAERIYGYSEAEALKMNVMDLVSPDLREDTRAMLEKLQQGEEVTSYETRRITKDGRVLDIWLTITMLRDDRGRPYMIATTERDITEFKKNLELRLTMEKMQFESDQLQTVKEELEVANEELLSTNNELDMALKNNEERRRLVDYFSLLMLRMVRGTQEGLDARARAAAGELEGGVPPERREALELLRDEDRKAATTMHDVASLLKVFSAKIWIEHVDLSSLVTSATNQLKRDDPHASVYLFIAKSLYAFADRDLIGIAIRYLLEDAWQHVHGDPGGRILFMVSREDSRFSFVIADSRKDYDIAESGWLSEPWEYPEDISPSKFRLALAKLIIERNGGEVWADDKKGSYSIHFKLPILP